MIIIIFYDFEVFEYDWLAVFVDMTTKKEHVIINSPDKLKALYEANRKDIWTGFNNRHYDQSPDTALGRIVAIRAEDNKEILKHFTPEQRRIRQEWMSRSAKTKTVEQTEQFIEQMRRAFIEMAGGEDRCKNAKN